MNAEIEAHRKYLFDIFSAKYGYSGANLSDKDKEAKNRELLNQLGKGVRFDPKQHDKKIEEFTERDYFRLFYKKE